MSEKEVFRSASDQSQENHLKEVAGKLFTDSHSNPGARIEAGSDKITDQLSQSEIISAIAANALAMKQQVDAMSARLAAFGPEQLSSVIDGNPASKLLLASVDGRDPQAQSKAKQVMQEITFTLANTTDPQKIVSALDKLSNLA